MRQTKRVRYSRTVDRRLFAGAINEGVGGLVFSPLYYRQHYLLTKHNKAAVQCHSGLLYGWTDWPTDDGSPLDIFETDKLRDALLNISVIADQRWRSAWRHDSASGSTLAELSPIKTATYWKRSQ